MGEQQPLPEVEQCVTSIPEDHEATCWGCGLRLVFTSYAPVYKCGWCGAVTQSNQTPRKPDSACFSRWRRFRDGFFVIVLVLFMLFVICGGVWAVYPVVFSISMFCGIFHCTVAAILSVFTIASYCFASFKSAGAPASIRWGSYPMVGKNDLENYTFCTYCSKPKPPRAHHCRSCKMCSGHGSSLPIYWELCGSFKSPSFCHFSYICGHQLQLCCYYDHLCELSYMAPSEFSKSIIIRSFNGVYESTDGDYNYLGEFRILLVSKGFNSVISCVCQSFS